MHDEQALEELRQARARGELLLPVKVPRHYADLVDSECSALGRTGGPLYLVVYPPRNRFELKAPGEVVNFVEDLEHMPAGLEGTIVHRYPAKLLYFPTDLCLGHCMYCFRPDVTSLDASQKKRNSNLSPEAVSRVVAYLRAHPEVREVIFSGGDPLSCPPKDVARALEAILATGTVKAIRFHTKAPVFDPKALSDQFLDLCEHARVRLVIHAVHPYELSEGLLARLDDARRRGISVYNQFPLLRGVNDHAAVIMELAYVLAGVGVQMLTMFIADPIKHGAVYRLRLERAYEIADEVFRRGEAWISNFRVCLDSPIGKVRREHIVERDAARDLYVFERDRRRIDYHDVPRTIDVPTRLEDLLYRGTRVVDLAPWRTAPPR